MKAVLSSCALLAGVVLACNADAQVFYQTPTSARAVRPPASVHRTAAAAQPRHGVGFFELLFGSGRPTYDGRRYGPVTASVAPWDPYEGSAVQRMVDPMYRRQMVEYRGSHAPGTIIIDTEQKFLFLVQPDGRAIRYGIGVARPRFAWSGVETVSMKREWPDWRPPAAMLKRLPNLPRYMPGGIDNPLGARALYLGSSEYRIHGTNEPWTIGQNVSSGCIRLTNDDVIDLYNRARVGAKVVVM
jgi:lipoprotein-anchoring transpeptidase ErfK/SrfK